MRTAIALTAVLLFGAPGWAETWITCGHRSPTNGVVARGAFTVREAGNGWALFQAGAPAVTPARFAERPGLLSFEIVHGTNAAGEVGIRYEIEDYDSKTDTIASIRTLAGAADGGSIVGIVRCSVERY